MIKSPFLIFLFFNYTIISKPWRQIPIVGTIKFSANLSIPATYFSQKQQLHTIKFFSIVTKNRHKNDCITILKFIPVSSLSSLIS